MNTTTTDNINTALSSAVGMLRDALVHVGFHRVDRARLVIASADMDNAQQAGAEWLRCLAVSGQTQHGPGADVDFSHEQPMFTCTPEVDGVVEYSDVPFTGIIAAWGWWLQNMVTAADVDDFTVIHSLNTIEALLVAMAHAFDLEDALASVGGDA
tara:strand:+ start:3034 stop:3498 length:465 start_codon:yes stop_codon:yes gene_type:complete